MVSRNVGATALAALIAPIELSDDIHRYVWDGELVLDGVNPYAETPHGAALLGHGDDGVLHKLNSPHYHSVYPPLAQGFFAAGVAMERATGLAAEQALKLLFILADLIAIFFLVAALRRLRIPPWTVVLYAWNPFVFLEVAAGGHTEALLAPWLILMVLWAMEGRPVATGLAIGLGALAKTTILVASPVIGIFLLRRHGAVVAVLAAVIAAATIAAGYAPFYFDDLLANHRTSYELYATTFSFNAPIFYGLRHIFGYREGVTAPIDHLILPWLTVATLLIIVLSAALQGLRAPTEHDADRRLVVGLTAALGAYLLLSPTFHPWYLIPVLLVSLMAGLRSFVLLSFLVPLSYFYYSPWITGEKMWALMGVQFLPFYGLLGWEAGKRALDAILRRRAARKYRAFAPFIGPDQHILDIGASEGYVGETAGLDGHEVELVDVVDNNRTTLPHRVYDGEHLPYTDDAFDVGVLSYVLHHCRDPDAVLEEAARVCKRLVILESTYETEGQRKLLTFLDHQANRLRGMGPEPLYFDTPDGWRGRFAAMGLEVEHFEWLGRGVHKHVLFVVCRQPSIPRSDGC
ncbi:MAG: methyltransferase domain-containing protein [Bradymonadaceae bacterium]